jgi:hypothetical protein
MDLTDWIVILAIALLAVAFFCSRNHRRATLVDLMRHRTGTRLIVQGTIAFWGALLLVERSLVSPGALPFHLNVDPRAVLGVALMLAVAGGFWSIRGSRLLRPRRIFHTNHGL